MTEHSAKMCKRFDADFRDGNAYNILCSSNQNVAHAESVYDAKAGLAIHSPAFVLLDFNMRGQNRFSGNKQPLRTLRVGRQLSLLPPDCIAKGLQLPLI